MKLTISFYQRSWPLKQGTIGTGNTNRDSKKRFQNSEKNTLAQSKTDETRERSASQTVADVD